MSVSDKLIKELAKSSDNISDNELFVTVDKNSGQAVVREKPTFMEKLKSALGLGSSAYKNIGMNNGEVLVGHIVGSGNLEFDNGQIKSIPKKSAFNKDFRSPSTKFGFSEWVARADHTHPDGPPVDPKVEITYTGESAVTITAEDIKARAEIYDENFVVNPIVNVVVLVRDKGSGIYIIDKGIDYKINVKRDPVSGVEELLSVQFTNMDSYKHYSISIKFGEGYSHPKPE